MNRVDLTRMELAAAVARGVRQLVLVGSQELAKEKIENSDLLEVFAVDEQHSPELPGTFVPTKFESEELAAALSRSSFDRLKASLFVWLGGASYQRIDTALATLAFVASLPRGSGVLFDYKPERTPLSSRTGAALDAMASRVLLAGGVVKHLIQPQAVAAMLRGLGFGYMTDYAAEEWSCDPGHLVSAFV